MLVVAWALFPVLPARGQARAAKGAQGLPKRPYIDLLKRAQAAYDRGDFSEAINLCDRALGLTQE